jgi:hypothetical protein
MVHGAHFTGSYDFPLHNVDDVRHDDFLVIGSYTFILRPEILRMSELNDSSDLQTYSLAVLYVLSGPWFWKALGFFLLT